MMKAEAEVNSRSSPTPFTNSLQQLIGCCELFSTKHKTHRGRKSVQFSSTRGREKKSIKAEWKVLGKKIEKWQIDTVLGLRNTAEQFIAGVSSLQKWLRETSAQVMLLLPWALCSEPAVFHQLSGSFTSKTEHKKCIFLNKIRRKLISLLFFFQPFAPSLASERGVWLKLRYVTEKTDQSLKPPMC